ncbi:peptidoglycan DD-metalloendopeptidase family protein [Rhizobium ruizarguesonis]
MTTVTAGSPIMEAAVRIFAAWWSSEMSDLDRLLPTPSLDGVPYRPGSPFGESSGFGARTLFGKPNFHPGMDFRAPQGTEIPAAAGGTVFFNGELTGYGNVVVLEHVIGGIGVYTLYGHMVEKSPLEQGASVSAGQTIGHVGSTGLSTGPHLHFEVIPISPNSLRKGHQIYHPGEFRFPVVPGQVGSPGPQSAPTPAQLAPAPAPPQLAPSPDPSDKLPSIGPLLPERPLNTAPGAIPMPAVEAPTPISPISLKPLTAPSPLTSVTPLTPAALSDFRNFWDASADNRGYSSESGRGGSSDIYGGYGSSSWGGVSFGGDDGSFGGSGGSPGGDGGRGGRGGGGGGGPFDKWKTPDEGDRGRAAHDLRGGDVSNPFDKWKTPDEGYRGHAAHDLGWGQRSTSWATDMGDYDPDASPSSPVLLDLSGNGLSIDELSNSSKFVDLDGDGYQHRTAWAGAGTGVLIIDANGDGKISQSNEFVFTEWDSSATSDLEALKHVFDTNGNGKLDAGDAQWSKFRVDVNGQLVTLDSLGITSIDLTPKGSGQTFSDGSAITGTTTFTRADGTTGTVGDATLANDNAGYIIKTSSVAKADSSVEKTIFAYNKDGSLAFRNVVTTSVDGKSVQTQFDDDGNGTFDRSQTNVLTTDASGVQTKTVSNFNADGSLSDRTTTVTSADHLTVTTTLDQDGDGIADQRQIYAKNADGSSTTTTQQLSVNGTVLFGTAVNGSANGLVKTTSLDRDGNGAYDDIVTETTTVAADGSRTKTVIDRSSSGKLLSEVDTSTSADGRTITVSVDADGNGPRETKTVTTSTTAASGDVTLVTSTYNTNASSILRSKTTTVTTANGLSKTTTSDVNADNVIDFTDTDVTVIDAANRTQTVQHRTKTGTTGTLLSQTVTKTSVDGKSITITEDANGDTNADSLTTIVIGTDGKTTNTVSALNSDGSLVSKTITETLAGGLSKTTYTDANGDTVNDLVVTDVITTNSDGSRTETVTLKNANGATIGKTVTTTASNSLNQNAKTDADGDGVFEITTTDTIVLDSTGARKETVRSTSADGTLKTQIVTDVSADRRNTTIVTDADGDGRTDTRRVESVSVSGNVNIWERQYAADASTISTTITDISGNGLTTTVSADLNHDGVGDRITSDQTVLNADGSKTETLSLTSSDATRLNKKTVVTSGNGMSITTSEYINGDEVVDAKTSDVTTFDTYGLQFQTVSDYRGTSLVGTTKVTTNLNGLSGSTDYDLDGDGTVNQTLSWKKTPLDPLGSVTTTETVKATDAAATLISQKITTVSADQKTTTVKTKIDSDTVDDFVETITIDNAGTQKDENKQYKASGVLESQAIITTTDDGLSKTSSSDLDADGDFELVTDDVTMLNADGSRTQTISKNGIGDALISRTTANVSASGLSKTVSWADATDSIVRSASDVTVLNADGGTTETLSYFKADGTLESKTIATVAAHGLSTTVTIDVDGDNIVDKKSVTAKQTNGSTIQTPSDLGANAAVKDTKTVTTSADGLTQTIEYDTDGNNTVDKKTTRTTVLKANGSTATTTKDIVAGVTKSITLNEVSGDGLTVTTKWDTAGTGGGTTFDKSRTVVTVLNASGSKTQTISNFTGTTLTSRYLVTTSANGLSITTQIDPTGAGTYSQTATDVTVLNANGTKTRTVESKKADGSLISRTTATTSANGLIVTSSQERPGFGNQTVTDTTTVLADGAIRETVETRDSAGTTLIGKIVTLTSADKLTVTVDRDGNGDDKVDQHQETVTANSGIQTSVTTNFKADGATIKDKSTVVVSADGRVTTTSWDLDGNGTIDRERVTNFTANADGSSTTVISDTDLLGGTLAANTTIQTSADGRVRTTSKDINGDATVDQVETVTIDSTGASVSVVTNNATARMASNLTPGGVYWTQAIAAKIETTTSADGRTKIAKYDYDGNGVYEIVMQSTIQVDGSIVTAVTETNASGAVTAKGTISTSADGLITTLSKDVGNNGTTDHTETAATHADGSITLTKVDLNASGAVTQTNVVQVTALGSLSYSLTTDSLGRKTAETIVAADGSSVTTTYDGASGQTLSVANANKAGLLTTVTFYDPLNAQGSTRIEQQYDAAGRKTLETQFNSDGSRIEIAFDPSNAAAWSQVQQNYNAAGQLTYKLETGDDGTKTASDVAGNLSWSTIKQTYDTANRLVGVDQTNDDSTRYVTSYDPANAVNWSRIDYSYNAAGQLTVQNIYYDNGDTRYYAWDRANANWSSRLVIQNSAKQTTYEETTFDIGQTDKTTYDVNNANNWRYYTDSYSASGALMQTFTQMDESKKWMYTYRDYLGNQGWTTDIIRFDRYGVRTSGDTYFDDGTRIEYEYHSDQGGTLDWWKRYDKYGHLIETYDPPVLLDLNGDSHIDLRPLEELGPSVGFDWDGDGVAEDTAWVGPQDGFLAIDLGANGAAGPDGKIDQARELAFSLWNDQSTSDLDGLRLAFDTNHDNVLDLNDDRWSEFRVWRDTNQNGISDAGELQTMSDAGIRLINLMPSRDGMQSFADGSIITGTSSYQTVDGNQHLVGDAVLVSRPSQTANVA